MQTKQSDMNPKKPVAHNDLNHLFLLREELLSKDTESESFQKQLFLNETLIKKLTTKRSISPRRAEVSRGSQDKQKPANHGVDLYPTGEEQMQTINLHELRRTIREHIQVRRNERELHKFEPYRSSEWIPDQTEEKIIIIADSNPPPEALDALPRGCGFCRLTNILRTPSRIASVFVGYTRIIPGENTKPRYSPRYQIHSRKTCHEAVLGRDIM